MNLAKCEEWIHSRSDRFFDFIRIYLGLGLAIKGISFLIHPDLIPRLAGIPWADSIYPFIPYLHLVGGILLALGILTRWAALVQIPILAGAVLFVGLPWMDTAEMREGFEFSCLVLFLLVLVAFKGAGPWSLSHRRRALLPGTRNAFQRWVDVHPDLFLDLIRVYLGVGLFMKGMFIMQHREYYQNLFDQSSNWALLMIVGIHYVIPAHFAGGAALVAGLLTRFAAAAQLPALIGAVVINASLLAGAEHGESFKFTSLVLVLLAVLTVHGSGRLSLDYALRKQVEEQDRKEAEEEAELQLAHSS
jgi:uncharacterized membrane protein YphA (DoxX/SURF4 family)